jgi:hypothetical protein
MKRTFPDGFSLAVALTSLLLTLVVFQAVWDSYFPPRDREALRVRREYYENVLLEADLSWQEGLYYKVTDGAEENR